MTVENRKSRCLFALCREDAIPIRWRRLLPIGFDPFRQRRDGRIIGKLCTEAEELLLCPVPFSNAIARPGCFIAASQFEQAIGCRALGKWFVDGNWMDLSLHAQQIYL